MPFLIGFVFSSLVVPCMLVVNHLLSFSYRARFSDCVHRSSVSQCVSVSVCGLLNDGLFLWQHGRNNTFETWSFRSAYSAFEAHETCLEVMFTKFR